MNELPSILIPIPPFFSFNECIWFLNRNYDDCLHVISENRIRKALEIDGRIVLFEIREKGRFLEVSILTGESDHEISSFLTGYIIEWFDMQRDMEPFYALLKADPLLAYMIESFNGLRLVGVADLFEALSWSIVGQQINLTFAYKLKRRLVERYGRQLEFENEVFYTFPSAETLARTQPEELREMQFSQKKAEYIIGIAKLFADNTLSKEIIRSLPDFVSRQKALTSVKGIGLWTANYALMKSLRESAGIPHGDVGLLNA
jgi:DNA-3-methyladenine glycosylase II